MRKKINFQQFDKTLFFTPILIFLVGIVTIYSASFKTNQSLYSPLVLKQILWMGVGALLALLIVRYNYFRLQDFVWPFYGVSLALLLLVLFMPARMGAHRWISLGGFNFQPSEMTKLAVILALAQFFTNNRLEHISALKRLVPFVIVGVPFIFILKQPDLGTGLTLVPILFAMLYFWGVRGKTLFFLVCLAALAAPFLFYFLKDYQKARLLVFVNPNLDPLGAGYNIIQSKIAIGSGGLFGKGFMGGTQNQLNFLPERHTDFIFSVTAEEGGFAASVAVVVLFWLIVQKGFLICGQTPDRFGSQLACGITTMIGIQALINLGMTMGLLPVVGMPLPLVSYGGTSVVITMLSIGLLLNVKMHRPLF
ncbi:MAG: rod shape-determining protein RodA [Candidatus Omnitrophota bacterium]